MSDLAKILKEQSDNHLTDLGPTVYTRAEWVAKCREQHQMMFGPKSAFVEPERVPDIQVIWESANDGHASITIELWDIGDEEEKTYDAHFSVSNNDNVGPRDMLAQLQRCVEQFYAMGLNTKFGRVIGD